MSYVVRTDLPPATYYRDLAKHARRRWFLLASNDELRASSSMVHPPTGELCASAEYSKGAARLTVERSIGRGVDGTFLYKFERDQCRCLFIPHFCPRWLRRALCNAGNTIGLSSVYGFISRVDTWLVNVRLFVQGWRRTAVS